MKMRAMRPWKSFELYEAVMDLAKWYDTLEHDEEIPRAVFEMVEKIPEVCQAMAEYSLDCQARGEWPKCEHQEETAH